MEGLAYDVKSYSIPLLHVSPTPRSTRSVQYAKSSIEGIEVTRAAMLPVFVAAIGAAQQDTPSPTFRAGTNLVEVDVVTRSKGAPATGLTKDDFTLLDNGKPQKIAFFSVQSGSLAAYPPNWKSTRDISPVGEVWDRAPAG